MAGQFTGGPRSAPDRAREFLAPGGGTTTDGARLAGINFAGIILGFVLFALATAIARLLDRVLPVPVLLLALLTALALAGGLGWIIYRYAAAHGRAARAAGQSVRPDLFGAIASLPFVLIGGFQIVTAIIRLLLALITLSGGRAVDALQTLGLGLLFLAFAAGTIVLARKATDTPGGPR